MTLKLTKFQNLRCHLERIDITKMINTMAEDNKKTGKWLHEVDEANDNDQAQQGDWLDNSQEAIDDKQEDTQH